jgi:hypothetical protein
LAPRSHLGPMEFATPASTNSQAVRRASHCLRTAWVTSPSSGTEQKGSRGAPSALYFGSHLELTEFATPKGRTPKPRRSAAWVTSPSSGARRVIQHS